MKNKEKKYVHHHGSEDVQMTHEGHSFGNNGEMVKDQENAWICSMHCEGDKTYDEPGNCPVCNMKLVLVESAGDEHHHHEHHHHEKTKSTSSCCQ